MNPICEALREFVASRGVDAHTAEAIGRELETTRQVRLMCTTAAEFQLKHPAIVEVKPIEGSSVASIIVLR